MLSWNKNVTQLEWLRAPTTFATLFSLKKKQMNNSKKQEGGS
jgi:hypothetical protein